MKKILIAIDNDFIREAYVEVLKGHGFESIDTKNGKVALSMAIEHKPDLILADVLLSGMEKFELLEKIKKSESTKNIPTIIFAQLERAEDRKRAMELEANDYITAASVSPAEVIRKIKIVLGEQKSYRLNIQPNDDAIKRLMKDLGYDPEIKCSSCQSTKSLLMLRNLSSGENHFIISFVCSNCNK